ncbi:protein GRAVITROPIC IN THE LIGHT 1-like [Cucumis melo]|uniref:Protein GRAVITROPIC IN THE LIGHT 1-like n=1 Tax=Cucumis melo TaxID=3656 RepID=A0A1S3CJZ8_CUCME|nr:protein GRAVITROPIC IN THE LIGHT 1-like [Cucumis melo]XP_050943906.1 protein GRAVITROPIC IN THE LIGHT 1-like [Cucumis melo]XP_050943907.1 protein GRAVITROPIC IN THE LIGHT 1-like [Cucumis melo]
MDSVKSSALTPSKSKLARTITKVLHIRALTGIAPVHETQKVKPQDKISDDCTASKSTGSQSESFDSVEEEFQNRVQLQALLSKLFASISSVKAAYAQLQFAQSPYDAEGIQDADHCVVSELKVLSELKQCYLKKQFDPSPETTMLLAEIQEQKSLVGTYDMMGKRLESQARLMGSEITFLREKIEEINKQNRLLEKSLDQSGSIPMTGDLHLSEVNASHFIKVLGHTIKSVRSFVRMMVNEIKSAGWNVDAAATEIEPDTYYWNNDHRCFAFETFVFREMFDSFHQPNFSLPNESLPEKRKQKQFFFARFMELKLRKTKDFLSQNPRSTFAKFCRVKYLRLVHPKMESSIFGNLDQRSLISSGQFPDTTFFSTFAEMARWVWLLHSLAYSIEPEASIFQVRKGSRFSEVYMESVIDEMYLSPNSDPVVAFTVIPGFMIGKTAIQCQVYLSQ